MASQCTTCNGSGRNEAAGPDEYGVWGGCPDCGLSLDAALARLERIEKEQIALMRSGLGEVRELLGKIEAVLRPADWIRIERNADGLDVLV